MAETAATRRAPIALAGEFVSAVMRRDYHDALVLCQALLMLEPHNETYLEFEKVLQEAKLENTFQPPRGGEENGDFSDDDLSDSSDSGNSNSSGDASVDSNNNLTSSDDDSTGTDTSSGDDSDDEDDDITNNYTPDELSNLNLLVGGLRINNR